MGKPALLLVGVFAVFLLLAVMLLQALVIVQRIATVSEVAGEVTAKARTDEGFGPLREGQHVVAGTTVRTGASGTVTLNWVDGSRVRLGPETVLRVRKCAMNRNTKAATSLFDLDAGRIWVRVLSLVGGTGKFEVRTPTATAGVRGTVFSIAVDESRRTEVAVYEGAVAVASRAGRTIVRPGEALLAADDALQPCRPPSAGVNWQEQTGIIGPRLDLDGGSQVQVRAGARSVTIAGVSEPGATVTIDGTRVRLDENSRFTAEVPLAGREEAMILVAASDARGGTTVRAVSLSRAE
ncbi:MAG: FecR domain-containing protein [Armatimonadota bacterium]